MRKTNKRFEENHNVFKIVGGRFQTMNGEAAKRRSKVEHVRRASEYQVLSSLKENVRFVRAKRSGVISHSGASAQDRASHLFQPVSAPVSPLKSRFVASKTVTGIERKPTVNLRNKISKMF